MYRIIFILLVFTIRITEFVLQTKVLRDFNLIHQSLIESVYLVIPEIGLLINYNFELRR